MTEAEGSAKGSGSPGRSRTGGDGDAHTVFRGTVLLAVSRVLDRASTFVIVILIAPRLGAAGVGAYSAAMALYGVFTLAGQAGATNYLVREISRDRRNTASYVTHLSLMALAVSIVLLGVVELVIPHLGYASTLEVSASVIVVAIPGTVLNSIQEATFLAHRRVEFETFTTLVSATAYIAIGAILLANHHGVPSLMWAYVALEYIATFVYYLLITRFIARLRLRFRRALAWRLVKEMNTFTASSLIQALFIRPEVIILSILASAKQVGYYGAAIRVAELPQFLPEVFMANVFTLMSAAYPGKEDRFAELQAKAVRSMLAFALPLSALMLATSPGIVRLLFGSQFHASVAPLRILSISVLFAALIAVFWRTLSARGRQDSVLRVQIVMIGFRLGGGVALIAPLAALGAAIATTVNSAIQMGLLKLYAARSGAPASLLRPGWRFGLAAIASGVSAWLVEEVAGLWAALAAGCLVYVVSALLLRAVSAEDRELLARLRPTALLGRS